MTEEPRASRRAVAAWCLYDWANSAFPTVVITFVFAPYFTGAVAANESEAAMWGYGQTVAAVVIAVLSPCLGAIADRTGRRKPWILAFSLLCTAATAGLWFVRPESSYAMLALILVGLGNIGFEIGIIFYNSLLPELVSRERIGRLSGWAWGLGYGGGLACLVLSLLIFTLMDPAPFGLDAGAGERENVRAIALFAAAWMLIFIWPLFAFVPDRPRRGPSMTAAVREGLASLWQTLRRAGQHRSIAVFLLANMIYIDGLNTLFSFGGVYAEHAFAMDLQERLYFGILLNISAGLGAAAFAWLDDYLGAKPTILIALVGLVVVGAVILLVQDKTWFYGLGMLIGIFMGPAQAASRSLMAHLAPPEERGEFFGLFALSGRLTSFLGPLLFSLVWSFADLRAAMATILPFFIIGALILMTVDTRRAIRV